MTSSVVVPHNGQYSIAGRGGIELPQLEAFSLITTFADAADTIPAWGTQPGARDRALRQFWPTEPYFASSLFNTVARYAGFGWSLKGGPRSVKAMQNILHRAEHGRGWVPFISKVLNDLYTQDNGAFIEVVRSGRNPTSPVVELNHLDSGRCARSGDWEYPVTYYDIKGRGHRMPYYNVIDLAEFPSPDENMRGVQYCALTRMLRTAQIMREIQIFNKEKVSGRFTKAIHIVGGMSTRMIQDAIVQKQAEADNQALIRFIQPVVLGTLDPTANVKVETINLANLPDNFNEETFMHWYVTQMALAFGTDYQDFAPLPGRGGSSSTGAQSSVSHLKSRGKGPQMFMSLLEQAMNFHGVMPGNVEFHFGEQDKSAELENILVGKEYALYLQILIESGTITPQVGRQMLSDRGFLDARYLQLMGDPDPTEEVVQPGSDHFEDPSADPLETGDPGPKEPPGSAPPTPLKANNNADRTRDPATTERPKVPANPS